MFKTVNVWFVEYNGIEGFWYRYKVHILINENDLMFRENLRNPIVKWEIVSLPL